MNRKSAIDPEELERRKFRAMCRFRALGRLVVENLGWMSEGIITNEIPAGNVRESIIKTYEEMSKRKKILSLSDKALLCKPIDWRTDEEKSYLYRIIGGLKCFRRYPKRVRRCLAAVSYFKYYGPDRVVIKEGHMPQAMYFVVNGELKETQKTYDIVSQSWEQAEAGKLITGDVFGHDSLLHNIPRPKTCVTLVGCGLLCVMKEDFGNVLQSTIQSQWDEIKAAMYRFTYFSTFSEIAIREGCMLAKIKSFKPDETILGDGKGVPNFAYFILSGQCKVIEALLVTVKKQGRKTFYNLYTPKEPVAAKNIILDVIKIESEVVKEEQLDSDEKRMNQDIPSQGLEKNESREDSVIEKSNVEIIVTNASIDIIETTQSVTEIDPTKPDEMVIENNQFINKQDSIIDLQKENMTKDWDEVSLMSSRSSRKTILSSKDSSANISNKQSSTRCFENLPKNVKVYFMQVCLMNAGGCFGLGETMKNRRTIAVSEVTCLLLPTHWLWQWNPANIWSRIKHFLDRKIPSTEKVFADFQLDQQWSNYKDAMIKDVFQNKKAINPTSVHDVPYSVRIDQNFDFEKCVGKIKSTQKKIDLSDCKCKN